MTTRQQSMVKLAQSENEAPIQRRKVSIAPSQVSYNEKDQQPVAVRELRNWEAVAIRETGNNCGKGVFAKVDFGKGYRVIVERPILSCIHWMLRHGRRTVAEDWLKLPLEKQQQMTTYFTRLSSLPVGDEPLLPQHKRVLEKFIEEYAFWDPQRARAHIYLLVSHINHACVSCANAEQWTDSEWPHRITIKLVKPVKAGEELFINYNRKTPFGCALCGPHSLRDRVKNLGCGILG